MSEQSNISFHLHKQCRIAEALNETVSFQNLRVVRLPTSTGVHCAIHALPQQPNAFQISDPTVPELPGWIPTLVEIRTLVCTVLNTHARS